MFQFNNVNFVSTKRNCSFSEPKGPDLSGHKMGLAAYDRCFDICSELLKRNPEIRKGNNHYREGGMTSLECILNTRNLKSVAEGRTCT
jgi:hypothetical protein